MQEARHSGRSGAIAREAVSALHGGAISPAAGRTMRPARSGGTTGDDAPAGPGDLGVERAGKRRVMMRVKGVAVVEIKMIGTTTNTPIRG